MLAVLVPLLSVFVALTFVFASAAAFLAASAQISAWAYSPEAREWPELLESPLPPLREDIRLFWPGALPDDPHEGIARNRHVRFSVVGWKWLRFGALTAYVASLLQLMLSVLGLVVWE